MYCRSSFLHKFLLMLEFLTCSMLKGCKDSCNKKKMIKKSKNMQIWNIILIYKYTMWKLLLKHPLFFSPWHINRTFLLCIGIPGCLPAACTTRLWLTTLACRLEFVSDNGAQPPRITYRICHLNRRGLHLICLMWLGGFKGSQKVTRPNPSEKDPTVAPNQSKGWGQVLWRPLEFFNSLCDSPGLVLGLF